MSGHRFTHKKRRAQIAPAELTEDSSEVDVMAQELTQLRLFRDTLLTPLAVTGTFNLQLDAEKQRLARQLWSGDYLESMAVLRESNPALVSVLRAQISSSHDRRATQQHLAVKERLVDGVLLCLARAQSMFNMPLVTAALSVLAEANQVPREFWLAMRAFFHGAVAVQSWVDGVLNVARDLRPPPEYEPLEGVAVGVFDNLSMRMNYGSYMREGGGGELKHMTNWFHCQLPRHLAPPTFDADAIFTQPNGMFARRSLSQFCRSFYWDSQEVAACRSNRWTKWLGAIRNGRHLQRPAVRPSWRPHKIYHPPIFDRLQSSYEDVRFELNKMRNAFPNMRFLFAAGDGLSLMRMNHLLASDADTYIHSSPAIIPIQGEHPHGLFHAMHCQWRLYRPFIMKCAKVVGNEQVKPDPGVSDLNVTRFFFLDVLTRAAGEYLNELVAGDPAADDPDDPSLFLPKAEPNVNFDWLCHFLHDAAFFILEFLESVRGFRSHEIDVLWREFFASAHTDTAHKTQYVGMAILRVFWGQALTPELDQLYHRIRSIPSGDHDGCGVGWDWAIEGLNGAIKSHVDMHVSEEQITKFVSNWALLEAVQREMRQVLYANRAERDWRGRDVDEDVRKLKEFFRTAIGSTWAEATRPTEVRKVTDGPDRQIRPWKEIERVMARRGTDAPHAYIRKYVVDMTLFYPWLP